MDIVQFGEVVSRLGELLIDFTIVDMLVFENIINFGYFLLFQSKSVDKMIESLIFRF